ncbi:MAG TPA: phosphate signaling complex protein PhoU [Clostridiales bacterium]|nr:phosphate signaling complex protein PhoU [Clostridiales bacterium]
MRTRFENQLELLNTELIRMGSLIEAAINSAVRSLINRDVQQAKDAILSDADIDEKEKEIESLCLKLLLQQQPVAKDLRLISAALKMITDMERIGDQAADIAEISVYLSEGPEVCDPVAINKMAQETIKMVSESINAFVRRDLDLVEKVIKHDDIVDQMFLSVRNDLIRLILEKPDNGARILDLLMIAKYLERIGDHATNIAEWVKFSITGEQKNYPREDLS